MESKDETSNYFYQFEVKSLDKTRPVSDAVIKIQRIATQMESEFSEGESKLHISVKREEAIPLDPITIVILIEVVNLSAKPLLEGFFKRLGEKMADYLSEQIDNLSISLQESGPENEQPRD